MKDFAVMKIDVDEVLSQRIPRYYRYIPRFIIRWIERTICQEQLNDLMAKNGDKTGAEFCAGVLESLNISYDVAGEEKLPSIENRRVIIVSNHPLGALDGMTMIDYITKLYGGNVKFVVNDLLMAIKPLSGVFLPINKHGKQSRNSSNAIDEAMAGNDPIIIFPAGLCSRRQPDGTVRDLKWRKMFVNKSIEYHRDIIPMYFDAENSSFFYKFAKLRVRLGLKFNIEMIYLPREIFRSENAKFSIKIGNSISWENLMRGKNALRQAAEIKDIVYNLKNQ
ncbi:MAG: 1-acyl-sn-glycerol-3-phosphate acyltransferase [Muribaculaceae bacterium]|nr:1-acyl-sn-glycerol-3-phosphate acyltransferase [Muribaculaceae bacterium]